MTDTDKRIALVIGGMKGIGRAIAYTLTEEGYHVIATSRDAANEDGLPYVTEKLDLTDKSSVDAFVNKLTAEIPYLNVLVNNAGIAGPTAPIDKITDEEWDSVFSVNVRGTFWMSRRLLPLLEKAKGARRIINIASMTGKRPFYQRVPYAASKMAVIGMTRSMALELGAKNITVNVISPGYVGGERIERVIEGQAKASGVGIEQVTDTFLSQSPLRRLVSPESIARMVAYLSSDCAQDITGCDFGVTAGVWMD